MDSPTTIIFFDPSCLDDDNDERNQQQQKNKAMDLDYEYSDDEASLDLNRDTRRTTSTTTSTNMNHMNTSTTVPLSPNRMLLIVDELDSASKKNKNNKSASARTLQKSSSMSLSPQHRSHRNTTSNSHSNNITRIKRQQQPPMNVPCPCCKAYVHCQRQPQKDKNLLASNPDANASTNSLTSLVQSIFFHTSTTEDDDNDNDNDQQHSKARNANAHDAAAALEEAQRYSHSPKRQLLHPESNTLSSSSTALLRVPQQPEGYTIIKCLMETWLYKKGSGQDVFGSTHWKPRWCQLVLANINVNVNAKLSATTIPIPVPLLLVSWHFSLKPSTVIVLKDKITIAVNVNDNLSNTIAGNTYSSPSGTATANGNSQLAWEQDAHAASLPFRFDIVQCQNQHSSPFNGTGSNNGTEDSNSDSDSSHNNTRTFALKDLDERDGWVYELNEAICRFEREYKILLRQQMRDISSSSYCSVISSGNGTRSRDGTGMGMNSYALPPTVPRVRLERDVSGASNLSNLEGLDLVL